MVLSNIVDNKMYYINLDKRFNDINIKKGYYYEGATSSFEKYVQFRRYQNLQLFQCKINITPFELSRKCVYFQVNILLRNLVQVEKLTLFISYCTLRCLLHIFGIVEKRKKKNKLSEPVRGIQYNNALKNT